MKQNKNVHNSWKKRVARNNRRSTRREQVRASENAKRLARLKELGQ